MDKKIKDFKKIKEGLQVKWIFSVVEQTLSSVTSVDTESKF
jgi:hypothetical protein